MLPTPTLRRTALPILLLFAACAPQGGDAEPDAASTAEQPAVVVEESAAATVSILAPAEGAELDGGSVAVQLGASGVRIVPAGDTTSGTGHHHLYLDEELGEPGTIVPTIPGRVIHLGTGASEYTFEDVAPGEHRLIAVVADGLHVPLQPWVVDTVHFTVR